MTQSLDKLQHLGVLAVFAYIASTHLALPATLCDRFAGPVRAKKVPSFNILSGYFSTALLFNQPCQSPSFLKIL